MGVIKKILYRGNILGKPRHNNLLVVEKMMMGRGFLS